MHPPLRGRYWTGQRPRVHAGFLKSWLAGNLKAKVVCTVLKALQDQKKTATIRRILVTGAPPAHTETDGRIAALRVVRHVIINQLAYCACLSVQADSSAVIISA